MRPGSGLKIADEEEEVVVVDSIDGPHEAWGCVIYLFLVKFVDEKKVVTDRWTDRRTHPLIRL